MTRLVWRALLAVAMLLAATAPGAAASSITIDGHFTQHFGGRNGELAPCPIGELICGEGLVAGYGRARDAFIIGPNDEFLHVFILADGSSITTQLEFVDVVSPGVSDQTFGATMSYGNPADFTFSADVIDATGVFEGATGNGTATLHNVGNVDQITLSLDLDLP